MRIIGRIACPIGNTHSKIASSSKWSSWPLIRFPKIKKWISQLNVILYIIYIYIYICVCVYINRCLWGHFICFKWPLRFCFSFREFIALWIPIDITRWYDDWGVQYLILNQVDLPEASSHGTTRGRRSAEAPLKDGTSNLKLYGFYAHVLQEHGTENSGASEYVVAGVENASIIDIISVCNCRADWLHHGQRSEGGGGGGGGGGA